MDVPIAQARAATTEPNTVNSLIPIHLREGAQNFIDLLEDYYTYLNTDGLPSQEINNILVEQDIDKTSLQYLDSIQKEVAMNVPDAVAFDRVSLYKKIVKYYLTKGSRDSILTFFKIFYDEAVVVSYPKEFLFAPSQGNYDTNINRYLDDKGFPSSRDKIQDSYFWQNFSYVIESALPVENWKSNFLNLVHPAGFKFFGIIAILMVRTNKWIGRHIRFDETTRKYVLTDDFDPKIYNYPYQVIDRDDLDWMRGLVPPALLTTVDRYSFNEGYHSPTFQFGLVPLDVLLNILIIKNLDEDRFNLFIEVVLNYIITDGGNHLLRGRDTYLQDTKFLDSDGFSEFKNRVIGDSLDDNLLMSQRILHNVSAFVDTEITLVQDTGRNILKRVAGLTSSDTTKDLYTQESYNAELSFVRNEECWAKDIKGITAISPWNSRSGNRRAGVAITPRHILFVEHADYHLNVGDTIYFVTRNNTTISRQIIQQKDHPVPGYTYGDFNVALLDSALPDDIEIMKVLPEYSYNYFPIDSYGEPNDFNFGANYTGIDVPYVFHTDQEEKALVKKINQLRWFPVTGTDNNSPETGYGMAYYGNLPSGITSTSEWGETIISGDSGNPIMMVLKGEAVLISLFTFSTAGPFLGQERNINDINKLIEDVDKLGSIDNSEDITSFVYNSRTFTKTDFLLQDRPVYRGEGSLDSISWDGNEWIEYRGGAFNTLTNSSEDTPYPWLRLGLSEAAEGFEEFTPNLVFGTGYKLTQFDLTSEDEVEIFTPTKVIEGIDTSFTSAEGYSTSPDNLTSSHPDWEGREISFDESPDTGDQWTNDPANGKIFCTGLFKNIRTAKPINARVGDIIKASVDFDFGTTPNQVDDERTFMLSLSDIGPYPNIDESVLNHSDLSFFIIFAEAQAKLLQRIEGGADQFVGELGLNSIQGDVLRLELEIDVKSTAAETTVTVSYENISDSPNSSMANNPKIITGIDSGFYDSLLNRDPSISMTLQAGELSDTLIGTINVYNASFKNLVSFNTEQPATITPTLSSNISNENVLGFVYRSGTYTKGRELINDRPYYSFADEENEINFQIQYNASVGDGVEIGWVRTTGQSYPLQINVGDIEYPWLELDGTISSDFSDILGLGDYMEVTKKSFESDLSKTLLTLGTGSGNYIVGEEITQTNAATGVTVTSEVFAINQGNIEILDQTASDGSDTLFSITETPPDYLYTAKQIDAVDESHFDVIVTDDRNFQIISDLANDGLPWLRKVIFLKKSDDATDPLRFGSHRVTFNCTLNNSPAILRNNHLRLRYRADASGQPWFDFNVVSGENSFTFDVFDGNPAQILFLSTSASAFDVSISNLKIEQIETPVSPGNIVGTDSNASYTMTGSSQLVKQKRDSFDTSATHIEIEDTNLNGRYELIYKSSDKLMINRPSSITESDSFTSRVKLGILDTYMAPSKYKKYTENIQQVKDKFS
jgi:hypothetical protein